MDLLVAITQTPGTHTHAALAGWEWPATEAQIALLVSMTVAAQVQTEQKLTPLLPFDLDAEMEKASRRERSQANADVTPEERARLLALDAATSAIARLPEA